MLLDAHDSTNTTTTTHHWAHTFLSLNGTTSKRHIKQSWESRYPEEWERDKCQRLGFHGVGSITQMLAVLHFIVYIYYSFLGISKWKKNIMSRSVCPMCFFFSFFKDLPTHRDRFLFRRQPDVSWEKNWTEDRGDLGYLLISLSLNNCISLNKRKMAWW